MASNNAPAAAYPDLNSAPPAYNEAAPQYNNAPPQYNEAAPQYNQAVPQYNQAAPQYNEAAPQYITAQQPVVTAQQPVVVGQQPVVGGQQPVVVYVQQPAGTAQQYPMDGVPTTTTNTTNQQRVVMVQAPPQTTANIMSGGDYNEYFRMKLSDPRLSCCFGCQGCCSLWIGVHVWLIIAIGMEVIGIVSGFLFAQWLENDVGYEVGPMWYALLGWDIIELCSYVLCFVGLYQCNPILILLQVIVFIINGIISAVMMVLSFNPFVIVTIMFTLFLAWLFFTVYKWAKYFKSGGAYDPNQFTPPRSL